MVPSALFLPVGIGDSCGIRRRNQKRRRWPSLLALFAVLVIVGGPACGRPGPTRHLDKPLVIDSPMASVPSPAAGVPSAWFPGWWASTTRGWRVTGAKGNSVLESTVDGGHTWASAVPSLFSGKAANFSVIDDRHAFFTQLVPGAGQAATELWATDDGGAWQRRAMPPLPQSVFGLDFQTVTDGWVLVQAEGSHVPSLWRTQDGGRSWSKLAATGLDTRLQLEALRFVDAGLGFVSGREYRGGFSVMTGPSVLPFLARTVDGGSTWTRINLMPPPDVVFPASLDYIDGVRRLDAGEIAVDAPVYVGQPAPGNKFPPEKVLIWTSSDDGATWSSPVEAPSSTAQFGAYGRSRWWASGRDGVFTTVDGGVTWSGPFGADQHVVYVDFVNDSTGFGFSSPLGYGANDGSILRTDDAAQTWRPLT